ncbi:hypothetical protein TNCV_1971461 [Trichonephila clavipes]|uniref:Uncharacterized protein n=1 Tax=Trichonephila clavipes TaxID=2585209 RepID=A0A8X6W550_TRICX|nr:hypothetical protein TNCV_1971461 [Trichonephila clavipes]
MAPGASELHLTFDALVRVRAQWMTVDDSLFLGTWTDKQSSIPYHDVCDAGLDFVGFFSLRSDMSAIWL